MTKKFRHGKTMNSMPTLHTIKYTRIQGYSMNTENSQSVQAEECDVSKLSAKIEELEMDKFMLEKVIVAFREGLDELSREYKGVSKAFEIPQTHVNTVISDLVKLSHGKEGSYFAVVNPFSWQNIDYQMVGDIQ